MGGTSSIRPVKNEPSVPALTIEYSARTSASPRRKSAASISTASSSARSRAVNTIPRPRIAYLLVLDQRRLVLFPPAHHGGVVQPEQIALALFALFRVFLH